MKRTSSHYRRVFRTLDQLLFFGYILVAGLGLCMMLRSEPLLDSRLFRFAEMMWICCAWTVLRALAKVLLNAAAERRGDDRPFSRDNIYWSRDMWFSRADESDLEY